MVHVGATSFEFLEAKKVVGDFGSPHYWYSQGALTKLRSQEVN